MDFLMKNCEKMKETVRKPELQINGVNPFHLLSTCLRGFNK
jgi:hypothetical protein